MTYENLFKMLETANENDANIILSYTSENDNISMTVELVPDVLIQGNWVSIVDKERGERINFAFMADAPIEYDENTEEYIIPISRGELVIAAS